MIKALAALSLIVALVLPHMAVADTGAHVHEHHGMMAVAESHPCPDGDCDEQPVMICCEMLAGHCVFVMLQSNLVTAIPMNLKANASWPSGACEATGLSLAFDPPPPRV